jgi:uncharacterized repeat protein (TIGR01451 family)
MRTALRGLAIALAISAILLSSTLSNIKIILSSDSGGCVDLFSEKEPFNGKGSNVPCDAFGPEENAILYALVTCNDKPVENLIVAFCVRLPTNASFGLTARTGPDGIATVNFTISTPPISINESDIFGVWFAQANVLMGDEVYQDTMSFKVDWVVKLLSVRPIDENLTSRISFGIGGDVGLEIALRSVSMIVKSVVLSIVIEDYLEVPVNFTTLSDFQVQPNEKPAFLYCELQIPKWAYIGEATVFVSAFTAAPTDSGVPYCPGVTTSFNIAYEEPLVVRYHDVAIVSVLPSATSAEMGQFLNVSVVAQNEGTEAERLNVTARCDGLPFGSSKSITLSSYSHLTLDFTLNTSLLGVGNHTLSASTPYLVNEADLTDNSFVDGSIEIKAKPPTIVHDIAVVDIEVSNNNVYIGDQLQVNVSVLNKGNGTETFNVEVHYNLSLIQVSQVSALAPYALTTAVFTWNTSYVPEGIYRISAYAPLIGDVNASDNALVDGYVEVKTMPPPNLFHDVAVLNVYPSSYLAYIGDVVNITVAVKNLGNYTESFNLTVSTDSLAFKTSLVQALAPGSQRTLVFRWDTTHVREGDYLISAMADHVPGETEFSDNSLNDGFVEVRAKPEPPPNLFHDIAVLNVTASSHFAYIGDVVDITVIVKNFGNYTESFNLTVFTDAVAFKTSLVQALAPSSERTLVFHWDTTQVREGNYMLSASASNIPDETNYDNNRYVDGTVTIATAPRREFVPEWFYWFLLLLLLILVGILLLALSYRRRKKSQAAFYSGWTAWYYGYDLRGKNRRLARS